MPLRRVVSNKFPRVSIKIKEQRKDAGFTKMIDLAEDAEIWPSRLSLLENGKTAITMDEAIRISHVVGCSINELIGIKVRRRDDGG